VGRANRYHYHSLSYRIAVISYNSKALFIYLNLLLKLSDIDFWIMLPSRKEIKLALWCKKMEQLKLHLLSQNEACVLFKNVSFLRLLFEDTIWQFMPYIL
jgi:hypothetical protein